MDRQVIGKASLPVRLDLGARGVVRIGLIASALLLAVPAHAATKVTITGDAPSNGIFDPSVEYAPGSGEGWLAYSAVFGGIQPFGPHVETHLARTTDSGATWTFDSVPNPSSSGVLDLGGGERIEGVWNHEVPSLVHDPGDPGAEWKLFSHRIFRKIEDPFTEEQNLPAYSWISYRSAPSPVGPWSADVALMSSGPLPPAPYDDVAIAVNDLDESLSEMLVYSEPGAFVRDGTIYLSLTGLTANGPDRIILLASHDHGSSWQYVATPLANDDASVLGFSSFDGSAIVSQAGRVFLLVTPESPGVLHDGTLAFEFESLAAGLLERDGGVPVVHLEIAAQPGLPVERRGGQADYHELNAAGGILHPALHVEQLPEMFQFVSTHLALVPPPPVPALSFWGTGTTIAAVAVGGVALRRRAFPIRRVTRPRRPDATARALVPVRSTGPTRRRAVVKPWGVASRRPRRRRQ